MRHVKAGPTISCTALSLGNTSNPYPYEIRQPAAEHGLLPRLTDTLIRKCLDTLPNGKALGEDGASNELLKALPEQLKQVLYEYVRFCWRAGGKMPTEWSHSRTLLIHKKGDATDPANYRPIGIHSCVYKLYSKAITRVIQDYLEQHRVLSSCHFGFGQHQSVNQALRYLKRVLEDAEWTSRDLYMLAVDFRSAFNSVDQERLYATMETMGILADACQAVKGIYRDASTVITLPGGQTNPIPVNRGTIQGDTLSPLLFLVAIDPLLRWLQQGGHGYWCGSSPAEDQHSCAAIAYADDLTILTDDIIEMKTQVKKIELFSQWSSLRLSPRKCALTGILHKTAKVLRKADKQRNESPTDWERLQPILQDVLIDGHPVTLKRADEPIKYPGVLLTMTQSWDHQVAEMVADMTRNYELLNRTQLGQAHKATE